MDKRTTFRLIIRKKKITRAYEKALTVPTVVSEPNKFPLKKTFTDIEHKHQKLYAFETGYRVYHKININKGEIVGITIIQKNSFKKYIYANFISVRYKSSYMTNLDFSLASHI